ncbi:MAG: thioredoxin domain-containing protein [Candidatus Latescibacteria bacterium]|nr:thioredoxin domain-containing protein [Candidatus Latescibacterota bacterium]
MPRTRHLLPDGSPRYTNRLFLESSPYLLQHAHNPVNWYPWGDEAFEDARRLGRPVFLSVGYSTCHWCHVMEEESFEDEEIARYMNENYIAIKVDREERPDIDGIYMTAVQLIAGRGGWPMSVWLTPDRKPFYGGTYFPARDGDRGASVGFLTVVRRLKEIYATKGSQVAQNSNQLSEAIQKQLSEARTSADTPGAEALKTSFEQYRERFDEINGGPKGSPKFPSSLPIRFLLQYHRRTGDPQALRMATVTLERMAAGGMYDQVGGGFHRYSTDVRWLVPHFEKMLYDNALLALAYLDGFQVTRRKEFERVVRETLRYADRDMGAPHGGFYSATDADSPTPTGRREEGWFFTWTPSELAAVLGAERSRIVAAYYAVTPSGNFEGRSILHTPRSLEEVAKELKAPVETVASAIEESRPVLYHARAKRPPPLRDEKILTSWNGLMISAFARSALVLGDAAYARRAERAAEFVSTRMLENGRLRRSYKDGKARFDAYLDDYAFLIAALLDLHEATGRSRWLREAIALDATLERHFEDRISGGFFLIADDHEELLAREKPTYDGAEPSGNSVQALNLLRLAEFTTQDRYRVRAERTFRSLKTRLAEVPTALSELLLALDFYLDTPKEVIIVTTRSRAEAEPFLARLRATYLPNRILAIAAQGEDLDSQAKLVPLLQEKVAREGKATAYVCEGGVCKLPTTDPGVFAKQVREVSPLDARPKAGAAFSSPGG